MESERFLVRLATVDEADEIVDFFAKYLGTTSPINKAFNFTETDTREAYESKIRGSISDGLCVVAVDSKNREIVGCTALSNWYRDSSKNRAYNVPKSRNARLYHDLMNQLEDLFWDLCPKEYSAVARGHCFVVRPDLRRLKLGERIIHKLNAEGKFKELDGSGGVVTSIANLGNMIKQGGIPLAEIDYEEYFKQNGLPFKNVFTDGTTKVVLVLTAYKQLPDFKPKSLKLKAQRAKL
ncbi:hypothetical protein L596_024232 [Steinernema carpocapsae]|uniref:N-acetyltransferase domain-containing protein n=1 Tax=Steinernema carpocapsae TaxID=34508 RepID=A0A4U5MG53_STECR|nr:hypothetical protein L596_024232 [Steinernema carpocapsae]